MYVSRLPALLFSRIARYRQRLLNLPLYESDRWKFPRRIDALYLCDVEIFTNFLLALLIWENLYEVFEIFAILWYSNRE